MHVVSQPRARCHTHAKTEQASADCIRSIRAIVTIHINNLRIVLWNINDFRIGRLDENFFFLHYDRLFFGCSERPIRFCFDAQLLNRIQHVLLLMHEHIAQLGGPIVVVSQTFDYILIARHGFDRGIPSLGIDAGGRVRWIRNPCRRGNDLVRVG